MVDDIVVVGRRIMMDRLPEGCIAQVLSLTTPEDACRLSLVGSTFHSAAESDAVWEKFLPLDYKDIISRAPVPSSSTVDSHSPPTHPKSKKQLYFWLSDNPLIIDQGTKSFSLEKKSGKRCYMLAARDLAIVWGDTPCYWKWTSLPDSRFGEVAELISVCWLEIRGKMKTKLLSPNTTYAAYLVFKVTEESFGFEYKPAEVSIGTTAGQTKTGTVYLDPNRGLGPTRPPQPPIIVRRRVAPPDPVLFPGRRWLRRPLNPWAPRIPITQEELEEEEEEEEKAALDERVYPKERGDGWLEIELGDYFINGEDEEDDELEMSLMEIKGGDWKSGLIVQGIEIRPQN